MPFNIEFSGAQQVEATISEIRKRLLDHRRLWKNVVAPLTAGRLSEIFLTEGYGEWQPLHPAYAAAKAITHPGKTILRRDDNYIQAATSAAHPGNLFESTATYMVWGIDGGWFDSRFGDNYPERHELGIGVAQRPVFGLLTATGQFSEDVGRLTENWYREEIAEVRSLFG